MRASPTIDGVPQLRKGVDPGKDQSYFLHAVAAEDLADVLMPLGELLKRDVRELARKAGLSVAEKKDSTGICFIGERPFAEFLNRYLPDNFGAHPRRQRASSAAAIAGSRTTRSASGTASISAASRDRPENAWYVAAKDATRNELVVVQGHEHPLLLARRSAASGVHWIRPPPNAWQRHDAVALPREDSLSPAGPSLHCRAHRRGLARGAVRRVAAHADARSVRRAVRRRSLLGRRDDRVRGGRFSVAESGGLASRSRRFPAYNPARSHRVLRGSNDRQFRRP